MNTFEMERYSLCIAYADNGGVATYYKYFRVADFYPEDDPNELIPAILEEHTTSLEDAQANPNHLYNPNAAYHYDSRESDFYLFQWRLDTQNFGKQLTRSFHDDVSILAFKEPIEVIIPEGVTSEGELRRALSDGIPFEGTTTSVFYIGYERQEKKLKAIRCLRKDFSFSDGLIKMPASIRNARETVLSAPTVTLALEDIIGSPIKEIRNRRVYAWLDEAEVDGSLLLRPLEYFAADYVKWFVKKEGLQISKSDRSALTQIIGVAFDRPDAIEEYLEAGVSDEELSEFKSALTKVSTEVEDASAKILRAALLSDDSFRASCIQQILDEGDALIEEMNAALERINEDRERAAAECDAAQKELVDLRTQEANLRSNIDTINADIEAAATNQDAILNELQANIALRLGLKAAAGSVPDGGGAGYGLCIVGPSFKETQKATKDMISTLKGNLEKLNIVSLSGSSDEARRIAVISIVSALAATNYLVVPHVVAGAVADALGACFFGRGAKKVIVPSDYRDVDGVLKEVSRDDGVVLLENVIDPVNEGILIPLLTAAVDQIVVLSFASHASLALVAKEAWGQMVLPQVSSLVQCRSRNKVQTLAYAGDMSNVPKIPIDDAIEVAKDIQGELPGLGLHAAVAMVAGIAMLAAEALVEDEPVERFVAQYLLAAAARGEESVEEIVKWADEDAGAYELAKKLGVDEL